MLAILLLLNPRTEIGPPLLAEDPTIPPIKLESSGGPVLEDPNQGSTALRLDTALTGAEPQDLRDLSISILAPDLEDPPLSTPLARQGGDRHRYPPTSEWAAGRPVGRFPGEVFMLSLGTLGNLVRSLEGC